ncbi:MAG: TrbI/VirB10 family protein, partial [Candidatus Heimdallarchaeota archaeon]|nr:TrbI/VirB10 family protein [Candidatus Heimdallarchaeota archaeon]
KDREAQMQKWNTQMLVISGGGQGGAASKQDIDNLDLSDPANLTLDNLDKLKTKLFGKKEIDEKAPLARTSSKQTVATYIGDDLNIIIAQGKIIKAVLETPIDTDFKGTLRAIISRDVYGENGSAVLIPKGSRLIGSYSTTISIAQSRVDVNWTRLLMPNGRDININEPGVDRVGRIGVSGDVRTKFGMVLTTSILTNGIKLGSAYLVKKILGDEDIKTTKDSKGNEVTTESLSGKISRDAINETTDVISNYISQNSNTVPTINVPQGTILNVFVNQDLFIPNLPNDSNIIE